MLLAAICNTFFLIFRDENFESITEDVESKGSDTEEYEECYELNQRQKIDSQHQTSKK